MGVRGLTTLVDDNKHILLSDHKLHDTRVIIDGSNLYHFLYYHYKVQVQYGGDYDHYAVKCKKFFKTLKKCNIEAYVVFDGGYDPDDRKLATVLDRMVNRRQKVGQICARGRGCILPLLAYETFCHVLRELDIPHVSCKYEADNEIAVLAHRWKCPVLSNDSDFFVYSMDGGFVPLDYMNLTLCVYNKQTEEASILEKSHQLVDEECLYIPVKYYHYEMFVKHFRKDDRHVILPLFATLTGNDYVDTSALANFYSSIHVPKNPSKKGFRFNAQTHMLAVLYWLDNIESAEKAIQMVLEHIASHKRDSVKEMLTKSFDGYCCIEKFTDFEIDQFLTCRKNVSDSDHRSTEVRDSGACIVPEMVDFSGCRVPDWFTEKLRRCEVTGLFLQNVTVNHRVILNCQIEVIREKSAFACSRELRSIVYGIVMKTSKKVTCESKTTNKDLRTNCIEEYDREFTNTKKYYVEPVFSVVYGGIEKALPSLEEVPTSRIEECKAILMAALKVGPDLGIIKNNSTQFILGVLSYWVRNAEPKVTESHLSSVILGMIMIHIRALKWLNNGHHMGGEPVVPELLADVVEAVQGSSEQAVDKFMKHLEKHMSKSEQSSKHLHDVRLIHGLSQLQSCLVDALYLNQVLLLPVSVPSPGALLNCSFVCNMVRDLESRRKPDCYLEEMLTKNSPLHSLFALWKGAVVTCCKSKVNDIHQFSFDVKIAECVQSKKKGKKCKKAKKEKTRMDDGDVEMHTSEDTLFKKDVSDVLVNCDVINKFAMLDIIS